MEEPQQVQTTKAEEEALVEYKESTVLEKYAENLLQFDPPVQIGHDRKPHHTHCHHCRVPGARPLSTGGPITIPEAIGLFHGPKPGHEDDNLPPKEIEEVLLHIFPPFDEEVEEGKIMRTMASQVIASESDVTQLNKAMEMLLKERHARPDGICPMRRQIFSQCMDEIIRQEILECPERGVVVLRLRNELSMTMGVYQALIHAAECYASGKFVMFESSSSLSDKLAQLSKDKMDLVAKQRELQIRNDSLDRKTIENSEIRQKKHDEEMHFLNTLNNQLKIALDRTVAPPIQKKA